jgi:RNA polymerase sigma-70 factor (ECF subfamily)
MGASAQSVAAAWQPAIFAELHEKSGASRYGISQQQFADILQTICAKYLPSGLEAELRDLLESLRIEELALARGCAIGNETAWTEFLNRYRAKLYEAAFAIVRNDSVGRELADSIYAELYGTGKSDGQQRVSKLGYYTGRGSLEGWLRAVLARAYVDRYRKERRQVSLEEQTEAGVQFAAADAPVTVECDPRVSRATDEALSELDAEGRFVLAAYFIDERTLAEIAHSLGVHESTISRKLERITKELRRKIVKALVQAGLSARAAEEALEMDVRDLTVNVRERLRPPPGEKRV